MAQGRVHRSVEEGLQAVELNPNHHAAVNNLGVAYTILGRLDEAVSWARRAVRLSPNNPVARANVVWAYANLGDTATAARWLREAEVLGPDDSYTVYASAGLHLARGEPDRAVERMERATELYPETPSGWAARARFALFAREYEAAVGAARRSLDLSPEAGRMTNEKPARSVLGYGLLETGGVDEGRSELRGFLERARRELDRGADYPALRWEIGAAHAALGATDEAVRWLRRAYEAGYRLLHHARHDPMLDPVRDEPRFRRIMAEMEAEVAEMRERVIEEERVAELR